MKIPAVSFRSLNQWRGRQLALARSKAAMAYEWANHLSHGTLGIWRQAFARFHRVQGPEAAAAVAYYAIFSLFPLILSLISIAGFLLKGQEAVDLVMEFIAQILPTSPVGLEETLRQVVARRDLTGIIGIAGLWFSASGVFKTLARNINRAWPNTNWHNPIYSQMLAFGLIAILATMMILWVIWSSLIGWLIAQDFPTLDRYLHFHQYVLNPLARLFPVLAAFLLFLILYHWLPNTQVRWREAFWGALFASLTWGLLTSGFNWFLRSGMANYDVLYGSLGTSIALLTWVYSSSIVILFGAHLSASIARTTRLVPIVYPETAGQASSGRFRSKKIKSPTQDIK